MRSKLEKISELTGEKYVEVKDGVTRRFFTGEIVPVDLQSYQTSAEDGFYKIVESTCGGGDPDKEGGVCKIGKPAQACIGSVYSKQKCAVYGLLPLNHSSLSFEQILGLMEEKTEREINLESALKKISKWVGEFPETGKFWNKDETHPMSYAAAFGSNGERDFMRKIASDALEN